MKKYWRSLDELNEKPDLQEEKFEADQKNDVLGIFDDKVVSGKASRRDFLKLLGFSVTSAALAASCERPVHKAIPYVIQPDEVIPGKALHFASSFYDGKDYCPVVVKTRDGRPIKIEGNELSAFNRGTATARVQASVLSLYDDARLKKPVLNGEECSWEELDEKVVEDLEKLNAEGKEIVLLTSTIISPATKSLISEFLQKYSAAKWIQYDAISVSAIRDAHQLAYGAAILPHFKIEKAKVLVGFNADFLGSWIAPVNYIGQYAKARKLDQEKPEMLRHYQFESAMTLTGSNADHRIPILPSEEKAILANLYNKIAESTNGRKISAPQTNVNTDLVAEELLKAGKEGFVLSGSNDTEIQLLVIAINELLGSAEHCMDKGNPLSLLAGSDREMDELVKKMNDGSIGALLMGDVNPVYDYHESGNFISGLEKVKLTVSMAVNMNETNKTANVSAPVNHFLETWDDAEIIPGQLSLCQPCIHPIFDTRSMQDSLLKWMGADQDYHNYLMKSWEAEYFDGKGKFIDFWNNSLREGVFSIKKNNSWNQGYNAGILSEEIKASGVSSGYELSLLDSVQLGDGRHANNPWLQELPDPIGKICWDNVLMISIADATELGLENGMMVKLNDLFEVPVLIQAGQVKGAFSLALGYGRTDSGKVADIVGANAFRLVNSKNGNRQFFAEGVNIEPGSKKIDLALTQTHNSMEGRPIIREANLDEYLTDRRAGNHMHEEIESHHKTLYPDVEFDGFHWGIAIDLNACVGCSSCMIACQAENNIPVVGKDEVFRRRIMHWIKIDRYYSDDAENPKVSHQPIMCQHCDNAPCENVCPVSATNHSSEGLNQMSYNRCVGTKYCINNCPYRARRFNWYKYASNEEFDYNMNSDLGKMVLNPDVTVRSRGVVEKCSFCVQRIQEKKLEAKLEGRQLKDGEILPACVQTCPAGAIVFGNLKDKNSKISKMFANDRNYHLLEELHTLPSVGYMTKIRNEKKDDLS